jgi:colanic acid/amylovoran biosynthesis protein
MKNKILVVPGNTDLNRGDQALVWESIRLFEDLYPNLEVYLYESGSTIEEKNLQKSQTQSRGYNFITRILLHPRVKAKSGSNNSKEVNYSKITYVKWGFVAVFDLFNTLLLISRFSFMNKLGRSTLSSEQKRSLDLFPSLKALVVKGGGFLHSYGKLQDPYVMYYFLFDLMLAHRYKVKTVVLPNSIGPLKNKLAKYLVAKVLKKSTFVSVREDVSKKFVLENLGLVVPKFPDLGFFLKNSDFNSEEYLIKKGLKLQKKNIAITLRPYRFDGYDNPSELYGQYLTEIKNFIERQINEGYEITLFAHTLGPSAHEDDRLALKDVYKAIDKQYNSSLHYLEDFDLDCRQVQTIYSHFNILIGTRFHSVIFALNAGTPAIAIAYGGNKSYGIMKDIGISEYVVGIESVRALKLNELTTQLASQKKQYLIKLINYQVQLSNERLNLIDKIKKALK